MCETTLVLNLRLEAVVRALNVQTKDRKCESVAKVDYDDESIPRICEGLTPCPRPIEHQIASPSPNTSKVLMCVPLWFPVVTSHRGWSRSTAAPQEAPASTAERSSIRPLLPLPACQGPPPSGPSLVPSVSEPAAPVQPSTEILPKPPSPAGLAKTPPGIIQEGRLTPGEKQTCPAPVHPQLSEPLALEPQAPLFSLICSFLCTPYHTQPF